MWAKREAEGTSPPQNVELFPQVILENIYLIEAISEFAVIHTKTLLEDFLHVPPNYPAKWFGPLEKAHYHKSRTSPQIMLRP